MAKTSLKDLPEVFVSSADISTLVSRAVAAGHLRKIGSRLYTKNMTDTPEAIVKRHIYALLQSYYPDALIADRTALDNAPSADGSFFIISNKTADTNLPGLKFRPRKGAPALDSDRPFIAGLKLSSTPRAFLENMRISKGRKNAVARTLSQDEIEHRLETYLHVHGEEGLNTLRDEARTIAGQLNLKTEFDKLDGLIGALLGTRSLGLKSKAGRARQKNLAYDPRRLETFEILFRHLREARAQKRPGETDPEAQTNLAFYEAYFSNFIEGTEFDVDEAKDIVFNNTIPIARPADAHDILGTYRLVSSSYEMSQTPGTPDELIDLLQRRHGEIMAGRPEKRPGRFKEQRNVAGTTTFVDPTLALGTLHVGFEIYQGLEHAFHRAVFMMFLISEVHPFDDGNGRTARIMMNAELVAAGEQRIIIPTVYRGNYLAALKTLTRDRHCAPLVRVLDFAQDFTDRIAWGDGMRAQEQLKIGNAFRDSEEAERQGLRLELPPH